MGVLLFDADNDGAPDLYCANGSNEFQADTKSYQDQLLLNDGKGNFTRTELPDALQQAPVFAFAPVPGEHAAGWLAGGNFYGVVPYEGRYDALYPTLFSVGKNNTVFNPPSVLPTIAGEIRDAKWINTPNGSKILVLARNNNSLIFLKPGI